MTKLLITYKKSAIGYSKEQKDTVRALGLRKLNSIVLHDDTPAIRGMAFKIRHLVGVEEVADTETAPARRTPAAQPTRVAFAPAVATEQAAPAAQPATSVAAPAQTTPAASSTATAAPVMQPVSAAETVTPVAQNTPTADDLTLIEGIGPKIAEVLAGEGITTFAQLAATDVVRLNTILQSANLRLAKPDTWSEQAALAAAGKWDEFKTLTEELKGGQRV